MNITNLDPFNIAKLTATIDRGMFRIFTRDFPAVVSEDSLKSIKLKLRDEAGTLITEMWNDIRHLNAHSKVGNFLVSEDRIPTLSQMAAQLPVIFTYPDRTGEAEADGKALIQHHIGRVKWTFNIWLQVYGQLLQRIADGSPVAVETTIDFEGVEELVRVPLPSEIEAINCAWQIARRLTFEYLQAKAELLIAAGEDVPRIAIDDDESSRDVVALRRAFWANEPNTSISMLFALRSALLRSTGLKGQDLPIDLRLLPTDQLIVLAHGAGVQFPIALELLGNIAYDLEGIFFSCRPIAVSLLYPFYRILDTTIAHLNELPPNEEVHRQALGIISQNAKRFHHGTADQANNKRS